MNTMNPSDHQSTFKSFEESGPDDWQDIAQNAAVFNFRSVKT